MRRGPVFGWCVPVLLLGCGAERLEAPRPQQDSSALAACRSVDELMPRFFRVISAGQTEGLRRVVKESLMVGDRAGDPPPINDVLRAAFGTLASFARQPPERGAPPGEVCATAAPLLWDSNPLCELRRASDLLVHQGKGAEAMKLIDPLTAGALNYVIGRPPASVRPHYEVATVISGMCQQTASCRLEDGLDLVVGLAAFAETSDGKAALDRLYTLVHNPELQPFLTNPGEQYGGENGVVALVRVVVTTIEGMEDPSALEKLPIDALPKGLQADARASLEDGKRLLDPRREPNILRPLKGVLSCHARQDPNDELVRMFYRLAFEAKLSEFTLHRLVSTLRQLRETDQRGSLLYLTRKLVAAMRHDEQALRSVSLACRSLFSTKVQAGQSRSNAQLALPSIADLFTQGAAGELLCTADSLVFGCTAGPQPACAIK